MLIVVQNLRYLLGSFNYALLNARYAESAALVSQVLALILSLVFFTWVTRSIAAVLVAVTVAESVALFILILPVVRYLRVPAARLNFLRDRGMRSVAYNYWLADLLTYGLSAPLAVLLIGVLVTDKAQIAYYALGTNLLTQISVVAVSNWKNVPLPALTQARITAGEAGFVRGWELFAKVFAIALFPVLVFAQFNARLIIQLLYGVNYMESAVVMQIGAAGFMLGLCAGAWSTLGALYSLNAERPLLWVRAGTSVLNIALIVVLAPLIGAIGAALAGAVSTTASNWIEYQLLRRRAPTHIPWTYLVKLFVVTAAAASVGLLIPVTGWLALVLRGGVLCVCLFWFTGLAQTVFAGGDCACR